MNEKDVRQQNIRMIEKAETVYFTTIDGQGLPQTRAMMNLRNKKEFPALVEFFHKQEDDFLLYFSTNTSSAKVEQIKANPAVCVYYCNSKVFHGLMLSGQAEIVTDPKLKETIWQDGWERYYPGGISDPDYAVLRLSPVFARGWYSRGRFEFRLKGKE